MSRRRKKNPLLMRIVVAVVAAHVIALPIAAHFGAFAKIQKEFGTSKIVMINVPPPVQQKEAAKKAKKEQKKSAPVQHKKGPSEAKHSSAPAKPNPALPKVVAANSSGGDDNVPGVDQGTGAAGLVPKAATTPKTTDTTGTGNGNGNGGSGPATQPKETNPVVSTPKPITEPVKTAPVVPKKFVQVETTYAPEPTIPDDLRTDPFEKTLVVEADVDTSGKPQNIKIATSSGTKELDDVGLDTAKKYRFKPATLGDDAVEGHVRFTIIFKVE